MKIICTSLILGLLILVSSCNVTKRSMREIKENNYYHDSTIVQEKLTIQPVYVPADTTYAAVLLRDLITNGKFQSKDRHYTTTIEYRDSTIFVETTSDSILLLLSQYEKTLKRFTTEINQKSEITEKEKKTDYTLYILIAFVCFIGLVLWIISKVKSKTSV